MENVSIEREFVGRDIASTGLWWRVDGQLVLEPEPDALAIVRREVFEAQRRWAIKTQIAAGRIAPEPGND